MCPPGVDQTCRTSQLWQIIAPRLRKIQHLRGPSSERLTPPILLFNHEASLDLWSALARPLPGSAAATHAAPSTSPSAAAALDASPSKPLSALEALPSELLHMIAAAPALSDADVVALGLASPCLWPCVLRQAAAAARAAAAPLAGAELACTGTWLRDMPAPFSTAGLYEEERPLSGPRRMCAARRFNWDAVGSYAALPSPPAAAWAAAWTVHGVFAELRLGPRRARALRAELQGAVGAGTGTAPAAADERWVLRDLDARAYVRCRPGPGPAAEGLSELRMRYTAWEPEDDASADEEEEEPRTAKVWPAKRGLVDLPDAAGLTIEDVLLLRMCWTTLSEEDEADPSKRFLRGDWAGHRFDIVPLDDAAVGDGWTDDTEAVLRQAERLADATGDRLEAIEDPHRRAAEKRRRGFITW